MAQFEASGGCIPPLPAAKMGIPPCTLHPVPCTLYPAPCTLACRTHPRATWLAPILTPHCARPLPNSLFGVPGCRDMGQGGAHLKGPKGGGGGGRLPPCPSHAHRTAGCGPLRWTRPVPSASGSNQKETSRAKGVRLQIRGGGRNRGANENPAPAVGRWVVDARQRRSGKDILQAHAPNWGRGRVQHWTQEEGTGHRHGSGSSRRQRRRGTCGSTAQCQVQGCQAGNTRVGRTAGV